MLKSFRYNKLFAKNPAGKFSASSTCWIFSGISTWPFRMLNLQRGGGAPLDSQNTKQNHRKEGLRKGGGLLIIIVPSFPSNKAFFLKKILWLLMVEKWPFWSVSGGRDYFGACPKPWFGEIIAIFTGLNDHGDRLSPKSGWSSYKWLVTPLTDHLV